MQKYHHFDPTPHSVVSQYLCKSIVILTPTPNSVVSQSFCKSTAKTAVPKSNWFFPSHYPSLNSYTRIHNFLRIQSAMLFKSAGASEGLEHSGLLEAPGRGLSGNLNRTFHWPWECPCDSAAGLRSWGHGAESSCHGDEPQLCTAVSSRSSPHLNNTANKNNNKNLKKLVTKT